jgi:hypothetical protein
MIRCDIFHIYTGSISHILRVIVTQNLLGSQNSHINFTVSNNYNDNKLRKGDIMKKFVILLLVLAGVFFADYFIISLVGIIANFCEAGCNFYETTYGFISWAVVISSLLLVTLVYTKKSVTM